MINDLQKRYAAPTPEKFRKLGDSLLLLTVGLQPLVTTLPLTEHQMLWVNFGLSAFGVVAKVLTNFGK